MNRISHPDPTIAPPDPSRAALPPAGALGALAAGG